MIIISYGRVEELVYYAGLKEQYETLIHHYVEVIVIANIHPSLYCYCMFDLVLCRYYWCI
jgi:hypothetical protein